MLVKFEVGKRAPESFLQGLSEGARLAQDIEGALFLILNLEAPTETEIHAIQEAKINSYVLTDSTESCWLGMFEIKGMGDFDCSFNVLNYSPLEWDKRAEHLGSKNLLHILLIDVLTGTLLAQRLVSMPKALVLSLHKTAKAAINTKDYTESYNNWLNKQYAYSTKELIKRATRTGYLGEM